jgi:hypothetical protein
VLTPSTGTNVLRFSQFLFIILSVNDIEFRLINFKSFDFDGRYFCDCCHLFWLRCHVSRMVWSKGARLNVADVIEMLRRAATADAEKKAPEAQLGRSRELLSLLAAIERHMWRDRREIAALRAGQALAEKDAEQAKALLEAALRLAEQWAAREPGMSRDELERLTRRLCRLAATANRVP